MQNEELTLSILRKIENTKSQKSLANELRLSVGKVNYILKALIKKGFIKAENFFESKNKNQYRYLLTKDGLEEKIKLTHLFIDRKKREYEELKRELNISSHKGTK